MGKRKPAEWETRISIYRNGRRVEHFEWIGFTPSEAVFLATADASRAASDYQEEHPEEFQEGRDD